MANYSETLIVFWNGKSKERRYKIDLMDNMNSD